jgi:hypothetical protein
MRQCLPFVPGRRVRPGASSREARLIIVTRTGVFHRVTARVYRFQRAAAAKRCGVEPATPGSSPRPHLLPAVVAELQAREKQPKTPSTGHDDGKAAAEPEGYE